MSESSPAPDLEDVRAELVDAKADVLRARDRSELNLATSALDVVLESDGAVRDWALADAHHHVRAVAERAHVSPSVTRSLREAADALQEAIA